MDRIGNLLQMPQSVGSDVPPLSARRMLALGMRACLEVDGVLEMPSTDRHKWIREVFDNVSTTLSSIHAVLQVTTAEVSDGEKVAREDTDKEKELQSATESAREAAKAQQATVDKAVAAVVTSREAVSDAKAAEKLAISKVAELSSQDASCARVLAAAESAFKSFAALDTSGAPPKATEAKRLVKDVEGHMRIVGIHETLMSHALRVVLPALQKKPAERLSSEEAALATAEGCFSAFIRQSADELAGIRREAAEAQTRLHRAKTSGETARRRLDAFGESLRTAREELRARGTALHVAESAQQSRSRELVALRREVAAARRRLAQFARDAAAFAALSRSPGESSGRR